MKPGRWMIGVATLALAVSAWGDATVYGALRGDVEAVHISGPGGSQRLVRVVNNSSYLGFRVQETLGGSLRAWAQVEGAVGLDDGTGSFAGRNTGVGLTHSAGTLVLGQWDSPYKSATGFLDPFSGTTDGVYLGVLGGNLAAVAGAEPASRGAFERRVRNVVQVWSPAQTLPLEARVAVGLGEASEVPALALRAGSLAWRTADLAAGGAVESHRGWQAGQRDDAFKLFVQISPRAGTTVGLVAERIRWRGDLAGLGIKGRSLPAALSDSAWVQVDAVLLAVQHHAGRWHLNLSVGTDFGLTTAKGRLAGSRADQLAAGLAYSLGPRTELCALAARIGNGPESANTFGSNRIAIARGTRLLAWGAGVEHRF